MKKIKRLIATMLSVSMIMGTVPVFAFERGQEKGGQCEHHLKHTEECGYVERSEESKCLHEHTDDCYEVVTSCIHKHTDICYSDTVITEDGEELIADNCSHECSEENGCIKKELNCKHKHDDECGYKEATEGSPCLFSCEECNNSYEQDNNEVEQDEVDNIPSMLAETTDPYEKVEFNGHTYQFIKGDIPWEEARAKCEELGGHLLTITSQEEQDFITSLLYSIYGQSNSRGGSWLGLLRENRVSRWITQEEFSYTHWNAGEPNGGSYPGWGIVNRNGFWNDGGDTYSDADGFICEWDTVDEIISVSFEENIYYGTVDKPLDIIVNVSSLGGNALELADEISWAVDYPEKISITNIEKKVLNKDNVQLKLNMRFNAAGSIILMGLLPNGVQATCKIILGLDGEGNIAMSEEPMKLVKGQKILIFATLSNVAENTNCTWTTSNPEIITFSNSGLDQVEQVLLNGETSISQKIYCQKSGSVTIRCTLSTGEWAEQNLFVFDTIEDADSYTSSNSYNRNEQYITGKEADIRALREYQAAYINAYETYADAVAKDLNKLSKDEGFDVSKTIAEQAKKMMSVDASNRYLSFSGYVGKEVEQAAYEGLCNMIYSSGVSRGVNFKNEINSANEFTVSNSIVKKICSALKNYSGKYTDSTGKYDVSINCFNFSGSYFGTMEITTKKGGRTYSNIIICSSVTDASSMCAAYMNALRDLGEDAVLNVYSSLAQDAFGCSLGKLVDKTVQKHIKKLFDSAQSKLAGTGLDNLGDVVTKCIDYYEKCNALMKATNINQGTDLIDGTKKLNELAKYDLNSTPSATSAATKKAYSSLKKAQEQLSDALKEYYLYGYVNKQAEENRSIWSIFQCPISIAVYNSEGTQIGYIGDDDLWYSDDILIEEKGDTKIICSDVGNPLTFSILGTDNGLLNCTFEEMEDGEPIGRVNYYETLVEAGCEYTAMIVKGTIRSKNDVILSDENNQTIEADEHLLATKDARVRIGAVVNNNEAGIVIGDKDYARGDYVKLYAIENEGYVFQGWYDEDEVLRSVSPCYEFTAREDITYKAVFVELENDSESEENKEEQSKLIIQGENTVKYGESIILSTLGGSGIGNVSYTIEESTGKATIDNNGLLVPKKAGIIKVFATKAEDDNYAEITSEEFVITIEKAIPSGKPSYQSIYSSGKTLADVALGMGTFTIDGSISWDKEITTEVTANTDYKWIFTPEDKDNYESVIGSIIPWVKGSANSSGSSSGGKSSYNIIAMESYENGIIEVKPSNASEGSIVTIITIPDDGYELKTLTVTDNNRNEIKLTEKSDGKYTFIMPSSKVTVEGCFEKIEAADKQLKEVVNPFIDVNKSDWFYEAVMKTYYGKIMNGISENEFSPLGSTTRGMLVTILYNMENKPTPQSVAPFLDVTSDRYYADAVAWAAENDIVSGYDAQTFGPNNDVTREQLVSILYRYATYKGYDIAATGDLGKYLDVEQISDYALPAMKWAVGEGIISGDDAGKLNPTSNATRAEVASIVVRFMAKMAK